MVSDDIYGVDAMILHRALASNEWDSFAFSPIFSCIDEPPSIAKYVYQRHLTSGTVLHSHSCFHALMTHLLP